MIVTMLTIGPTDIPRALAEDWLLHSAEPLRQAIAASRGAPIVYSKVINGSRYPAVGWRYVLDTHAGAISRVNSLWWMGQISASDAAIEYPLGVDWASQPPESFGRVVMVVSGFAHTAMEVSFDF